MNKTKKILTAIQEHLNLKNFKELAAYLGIETSLLYSWVRHDKIAGTGKILAKIRYLSHDWLETGKGPMMIIDKDNIDQFPLPTDTGKQPPDQPVVVPKIRAKIEPGNKKQRQRIEVLKNGSESRPQKESINPEKNTDDDNWSMSDMLSMAETVLESNTVYRSALASNVRAFYQAVKNEDEMNSISEQLKEMVERDRDMASRLDRMERMMELMVVGGGEKREQNAS